MLKKRSQKFQMKTTKKIDPKQQLIIQSARYNNDLRRLLRPWYTFRLFIRFNKPIFKKGGGSQNSSHFYGFEESCTYNQCLHGHFKNIVLNKLKGYAECIQLAEEKYKGDYKSATIYSRSVFPGGDFDVEHRQYGKDGIIEKINDPVLTETDSQTIFFSNIGGFLMLHPHKEPLNIEQIDWQKEVSEKPEKIK